LFIFGIDSSTGWKVGDKLGLLPWGRSHSKYELVTIKEIDGSQVTLEETLQYFHYGNPIINASNTGSIDIRTEVLHLSRNIKIIGDNNDDWGMNLVTTHNEDTAANIDGEVETVYRKGYAIIDSVEFMNWSQYQNQKAWIRFENYFKLEDDDTSSFIK
jgi:hypothetical protein